MERSMGRCSSVKGVKAGVGNHAPCFLRTAGPEEGDEGVQVQGDPVVDTVEIYIGRDSACITCLEMRHLSQISFRDLHGLPAQQAFSVP